MKILWLQAGAARSIQLTLNKSIIKGNPQLLVGAWLMAIDTLN
jgi:hypothetical protein